MNDSNLVCCLLPVLIMLWVMWPKKREPAPTRSPISSEVRTYVLQRDGFRCVYCGGSPERFHLDHVMPKSRGGTDDANNLVASCPPCNLYKGAKTPQEAGMRLYSPAWKKSIEQRSYYGTSLQM